MLGFFVAGSDLITWELTAEDPPAGYRLAVRHSLGVIVEYFQDVNVALCREQQLEDLLIASRAAGASV